MFNNYNYQVTCSQSARAYANCVLNNLLPVGYTDMSQPGIGTEIVFLCLMPIVYFGILAYIEGAIIINRKKEKSTSQNITTFNCTMMDILSCITNE